MLSRKQFFKQCVSSLGTSLREVRDAVGAATAQVQSSEPEASPQAKPGENMVAIPRNRFCLARGCGCFTCLERCGHEAIQLVPGEGVSVDPALCVGCGTCESLCPVSPTAIQLQPRSACNETQKKK